MKTKNFLGVVQLLIVLPFLDELISDVEVTVKVEPSGFVMQIGTSLTFIE